MAKTPTLQVPTDATKLLNFRLAALKNGTTMTDVVNAFMDAYIKQNLGDGAVRSVSLPKRPPKKPAK